MPNATKTKSKPSKKLISSVIQPSVKLRLEGDAVLAMWGYYQDHRAELIDEIKEFRKEILAELIAGHSPAEVFTPYVIQAELSKTKRRKVKKPEPVTRAFFAPPVLLSQLVPTLIIGRDRKPQASGGNRSHSL